MKRRWTRRGLAAGAAGVLLTGTALALGQGDSLISLGYLNRTYIPTVTAQGAEALKEEMDQAYRAAMQRLERAAGQAAGQSGAYSETFASRTFSRGDRITLETGSGFLMLAGQAVVNHNGAVIDVTLGQELPSGGALAEGHRYLAGEGTSAQITVRSGLARGGIQGGYELEVSGAPAAPFIDVSDQDWYCSAVDYAYFGGLFSGTGEDAFAPQATMNRAMMMTVLYHLAGSPEEERLSASASFRDVPGGEWFATFISWAAEQGVSAGTGNGQFSPYQAVTRQQVIVLLYNFAQNYMGLTLSERGDITGCADYDRVPFWSRDALSWGMAAGVIAPSDSGRLEPERDASRAEVASMLMMFSRRYFS